jgi:hypothetical protein
MDEHSEEVVEGLCDPTVSTIEKEYVALNPSGVKGLSAALKQNTVLTALSLYYVYCDTLLAANELGDALGTNRALKRLRLYLADPAIPNEVPPPMQSEAFIEFVQRIPYSNLEALDLGRTDMSLKAAQAFATTFQQHPRSPLRSLNISWTEGKLTDPQYELILRGLEATQCLTAVGLGTFAPLNAPRMVALMQAVGNTSIAYLDPWCRGAYVFNATEEQAFRDAIEQARCFLGFRDVAAPCFSASLMAFINDTVYNRTACVRNATCDVPLEPPSPPTSEPTTEPTPAPSPELTTEPTPAPSPNSTAAAATVNSDSQPFAIGFPTALGGIAVVLLTAWGIQKCRKARAEQAETEGAKTATGLSTTHDLVLDTHRVVSQQVGSLETRVQQLEQKQGRVQMVLAALGIGQQPAPVQRTASAGLQDDDLEAAVPPAAAPQPRPQRPVVHLRHRPGQSPQVVASPAAVQPERVERGVSPLPQTALPPSPAEPAEEDTLDLDPVEREGRQQTPVTPRTRRRPEFTGGEE